MTPAPSAGPGQALAESIRRLLGTDIVVLITTGQPACAVVIAPEQDLATQPKSPREPSTDAAPTGHTDRIAYSVAEAATVVGLSRDLVYDQLRSGRLGSLKVGRRRIITREQIAEFLAGEAAGS